MIREIRRHGVVKGIRIWFTWCSVDDIVHLTNTTARRRAFYDAFCLKEIFG